MEKELYLRINPKYRLLVAPLAEKDRQLQEYQSVARGASPLIYVWDNTILMDYEIYSFCRSRGIPLNISELKFQHSEEVIIWICKNQLQRTDLLEAMEKYLIGKQFQAEKVLGNLRVAEVRKDVKVRGVEELWQVMARNEASATGICERLSDDYHVSCGTVRKYRIYAAVLDQLFSLEPTFVQRILGGEIHISHENLVEISKKRPPEIRKIIEYFLDAHRANPTYSQYCAIQAMTKRKPPPCPAPIGSIKELPAFDPDAEVVSLALTIPSWVGSIQRVKKNIDYSQISERARDRLLCQLQELANAAEGMAIILKEAQHG